MYKKALAFALIVSATPVFGFYSSIKNWNRKRIANRPHRILYKEVCADLGITDKIQVKITLDICRALCNSSGDGSYVYAFYTLWNKYYGKNHDFVVKLKQYLVKNYQDLMPTQESISSKQFNPWQAQAAVVVESGYSYKNNRK